MAKPVPCKICKKRVMQWTKKCPECGVAHPGTTAWERIQGRIAGVILAILVLGGGIFWAYSPRWCAPRTHAQDYGGGTGIIEPARGFICTTIPSEIQSWLAALSHLWPF